MYCDTSCLLENGAEGRERKGRREGYIGRVEGGKEWYIVYKGKDRGVEGGRLL